eukprot:CAMPEP_0173069116 /NCGR_PEP_ID=MMETSP1102-20130122/7820_1 /TAXON_ID=49646 /ORGANISM="Geminigera sp., Strain Caron Lab Isolate" /LENGTH=254 /DNA_ID=CAMNT_0013937113 /DNA_START=61 /DNA_END=827 /DNA_ORIENTATION=+
MSSSSYASSAGIPLFDCTDSSTKPAQSKQSLKRLKDTATQDKHTRKRSGQHKEKILARIHRDIQAVAAIEAAEGLNCLSFERAGTRTASEPKNEKTRSRRMISPREHNSGTIKGVPTTGRLPPIAIDLYCLRPLLNMPQPQAAQKLGVSITSLKMACGALAAAVGDAGIPVSDATKAAMVTPTSVNFERKWRDGRRQMGGGNNYNMEGLMGVDTYDVRKTDFDACARPGSILANNSGARKKAKPTRRMAQETVS